MLLRVATYNVNSIRIRLHAVKKLVEEYAPDIICLQETKVEDEKFPLDDVKAMGFSHVVFSGQKSYNGVAILSKIPLLDVHSLDLLDAGHKRHIGVRIANDLFIHNFYMPAGGDIPDRILNEKFDFKLRCYAAISEWSRRQKKNNQKMIFVGDLNIAPLANDVWSHKQLLKVVSHTPIETEAMEHFRQTLGWVDTARHFVPDSQKLYSWWSYRNQDWQKSDRGRRLDHIWVTPVLKAGLHSSRIVREARGWDTPSDHVPVITEINI
jgi:exodeoxyribonuclease III